MTKKVDDSIKTISAEKLEAKQNTIAVLSKVRRPEAVDSLDMQCLLKLIVPSSVNGRAAEDPYAIIPLSTKKDWFYLVYPDGTLQTKYSVVGNLVIGEGMVYPHGNQVTIEADGSKRSPMCFTATVSRNINELNAVGMATQSALSMALGNAGFQTPAYIEFDEEKSILLRTDETRLEETLDVERGTQLFGTAATSEDTSVEGAKPGKREQKGPKNKGLQKSNPAQASTSSPVTAEVSETPEVSSAPEGKPEPDVKQKSEPKESNLPPSEEATKPKIPETLEEALATIVTVPGGFRNRTMKEVIATATSSSNARRRLDRMADKQYINRQGGSSADEGEELFQVEQAAVKILCESDLDALVESMRRKD